MHLFLRKVLASLVLVLFLLLLSGCGGGTSGSDGGVKVAVSGVIRSPQGEPLSNTSVTALETGDSTTTDGKGKFTLLTERSSSEITLLIEATTGTAKVTVSDIPQEDSKIEISLEFDPTVGTVSVVSISVVALPTPTPTTTPGKSPSSFPTATATPVRESTLNGKIIGPKGNPVSGVQIRIEKLNKATTSDTRGRFTFNFPSQTSQLKLNISYRDINSSVTLRNLPSYPAQIGVTFLIVFLDDKGFEVPNSPERNVASIKVSVEEIKVRGR